MAIYAPPHCRLLPPARPPGPVVKFHSASQGPRSAKARAWPPGPPAPGVPPGAAKPGQREFVRRDKAEGPHPTGPTGAKPPVTPGPGPRRAGPLPKRARPGPGSPNPRRTKAISTSGKGPHPYPTTVFPPVWALGALYPYEGERQAFLLNQINGQKKRVSVCSAHPRSPLGSGPTKNERNEIPWNPVMLG